MFETLLTVVKEDWIGASVQLFFAYTIILMIIDAQKPPVQTAVLTGLALVILSLGGSFASPITSGLNFLNGVLWLFIGYQRYRQNH
jgi:hypothetical protein